MNNEEKKKFQQTLWINYITRINQKVRKIQKPHNQIKHENIKHLTQPIE